MPGDSRGQWRTAEGVEGRRGTELYRMARMMSHDAIMIRSGVYDLHWASTVQEAQALVL